MNCPAGFTSEAGAKKCIACEDGTYSDSPGAGACKVCWAGTVAKKDRENGTLKCTACVEGRYIAEAGGKHCNPCSMFASSKDIGDLTATGWTSAAGSSHCFEAPAGRYSDVHSLTHPCGLGKYSLRGKKYCNDCAVQVGGLYGPGWVSQLPEASAVCVECGEGTQQEGKSCVLCETGKYSREGYFACKPCGAGTYSEGPG